MLFTLEPLIQSHLVILMLLIKALKILDNLIVAISDGSNKNYLFNAEERIKHC